MNFFHFVINAYFLTYCFSYGGGDSYITLSEFQLIIYYCTVHVHSFCLLFFCVLGVICDAIWHS